MLTYLIPIPFQYNRCITDAYFSFSHHRINQFRRVDIIKSRVELQPVSWQSRIRVLPRP